MSKVAVMNSVGSAAPIRARGHILFVDDDPVFAEASAQILRGAGYQVQLAPDYRLALQLLESDTPLDLMVCDIVMPERVNGLALGRMARLRRRELKIVYITGHDIPGIEDEALGPVLRKPIDNDLLVWELERALAP
jgi:CheY-like chemotaxis protein